MVPDENKTLLEVIEPWIGVGITSLVLAICVIVISVCLFKMLRKDKTKKRKPYKTLAVFSVIAILDIPFFINELYKCGTSTEYTYITMWEAESVLSFYGTFLAFVGTVSLGLLALLQNIKFKQENDLARQKLENINNKLLDLDVKKQKENLLELHFEYMEENQKLYDPEYVLQKIKQSHDIEEIFFRLKKAERNATSLKRRLMFFDCETVKNNYFDYCGDKSREIINLTMQKDKESTEVVKEIFAFWKSNSTEFNDKSLLFIYETSKRLRKEEK